MNMYISLIILIFISLILFTYFRNRQAKRKDERREKLLEKQEELRDMLRNSK